MKNDIACLIPAAGKGSRSGLEYPKTLYKINSIPIIVRILKILKKIDNKPSIVINKKYLNLFKQNMQKYDFNPEFLFQRYQKGMGNSVLQFKNSLKNHNNILLVWGDIPFIRRSTIDKLIHFHFKNNNDFSLITKFVSDPYTIVKRDKDNKVKSIIETKIYKRKSVKFGEREIGLFLFKKNIVFKFLKKKLSGKFKGKEHGFLYIVEHLAKAGCKIEAMPFANNKEIISFNSLDDLK